MVLPKYIQTLQQKYVPNFGVNLASGYLLTFSLMGVNILFGALLFAILGYSGIWAPNVLNEPC